MADDKVFVDPPVKPESAVTSAHCSNPAHPVSLLHCKMYSACNGPLNIVIISGPLQDALACLFGQGVLAGFADDWGVHCGKA